MNVPSGRTFSAVYYLFKLRWKLLQNEWLARAISENWFSLRSLLSSTPIAVAVCRRNVITKLTGRWYCSIQICAASFCRKGNDVNKGCQEGKEPSPQLVSTTFSLHWNLPGIEVIFIRHFFFLLLRLKVQPFGSGMYSVQGETGANVMPIREICIGETPGGKCSFEAHFNELISAFTTTLFAGIRKGSFFRNGTYLGVR